MRKPELVSSLSKALRELRGRRVAILTHGGGDADSIGSAYVLSNLLRKHYGVEEIFFTVPGSISTHSKVILNYLEFELSEVEDADTYIVVDAGSPEQLEDYLWIFSSGREIIVVDHHETSVEVYRGVKLFASDNYQSVCELVYELAEYEGYSLKLREAEALFLGIYYDTVRLSVADEETLSKVCRLAGIGVKPMKILSQLETTMDVSERIARLKAAMRMKVYRLGDWVIALSRVSGFQSSAARSLISLGVHASIVAGESDEGVQASMRAVQDIVKAGLDLGKLASRIGEEFEGHGGGHATAAGAFCKTSDLEKVLKRCLELIEEQLGVGAEQVSP